MFKKILKLSPAWLVTLITLLLLGWTTFSGGSVEDQSLIIKGNEYSVSYQFKPGLQEVVGKVIKEAKQCKLTTEGSVCDFIVKVDTNFKITLVKLGETVEPETVEEGPVIENVDDEDLPDTSIKELSPDTDAIEETEISSLVVT